MAFNKRRRELSEARQSTVMAPPVAAVQRAGFMSDIPRGGTTPDNPGTSGGTGSLDRSSFLDTLKQAYFTCTWASACVDSIARTTTAGGVQVVPMNYSLDDPEIPDAPPAVQEVEELLAYINPEDDLRQMMRGIVTDLMIYGDSFTEVVYFQGKPLSLYSLDPTTMTIVANEHGTVKSYVQTMPTGRQVIFEPDEVIHVKFDSPGGGLYGISPTQKAILPITSWLFTAALQKEAMRKGDPPRLWVDWPLSLPPSEMERMDEQYHVRNLGAKNMGNLLQTKGDTTLKELSINALANWANAMDQRRDEMMSEYGVPPSKIGVIEAGNLGGGTGTSQDKTYMTNVIGPLSEIVMEKFTFKLLCQCYKVADWRMQFGRVDWRDDITLEQIYDMRIRNGIFTLNRARTLVGEPTAQGGDDPILVDRQNMILWSDLGDLSKANVSAVQATADAAKASATATTAGAAAKAAQPVQAPGAPTPQGGGSGSGSENADIRQYLEATESLNASWRKSYAQRRKQALKELPRV